jgi:hypothetical protein
LYIPLQMFQDLGERHLIRPDNIKRGKLLGRGAFGFVFRGSCKLRGASSYIDVAMKMLQPVQPGPNARQSALIAYKVDSLEIVFLTEIYHYNFTVKIYKIQFLVFYVLKQRD